MENPCFNGYCLFCPGQPEICGHHNAFKGTRKTPPLEELDVLDSYFQNRPFMKTPMADIIQFAVFSAMRDSEITRITWSDFNINDKTIIVRDRKHPKEEDGNDQEVPLPGKTFDIVMKQPHTSERIFHHQPYTVSTLFTRTCKRLQIEDLRFYDLRHEGISRSFEQGYTIEQVMLVSGYRDPQPLFWYIPLKANDLHC